MCNCSTGNLPKMRTEISSQTEESIEARLPEEAEREQQTAAVMSLTFSNGRNCNELLIHGLGEAEKAM